MVNSLLDVVAADGVLTLREAIQAANTDTAVNEAPAGSATDADVITFDPMLLADGPAKIALVASTLQISESLTINGPGAELLGIDRGSQRSPIFNIAAAGAAVSIVGLAIRAPASEAIVNTASMLTVSNVRASSIGNGGTLTMDNVAIDGHTFGGLGNSGTVVMTQCMISGSDSGGIYNSGMMDVSNSSVFSNRSSEGGGITNDQKGNLVMRNVTVAGNWGYWGGGVLNRGSLTMINSAIAGNYWGGVVTDPDVAGASAKLINTIVAGNSIPFNWPPYYPDVMGTLAPGSDYNLIGILDPSQVPSAGAHTLFGTASAPLDPKLGELTQIGNTIAFPLLPESPAVDAGDNVSAVDSEGNPLTQDQAGNPRISGLAVDIGPIEGVSLVRPGVVYVVQSLDDNVQQDGVLTLREAFEAANLNQPVGDGPAGSFTQRDTISLKTGLTGTAMIRGSWLDILGSVTVEGAGSDLLTFQGDGQNVVIRIASSGDAIISGIGIAHGNGGIINMGRLAVTDGFVSGNSGNGISNDGIMTARGVVLASNTGSGAYNRGSLTISDATISGNSGSGVENESVGRSDASGVTLADVTIVDNQGAGIGNTVGNVVLTNGTVTRNSAGGLWNDPFVTTLTAMNSIVVGNQSPNPGADVANQGTMVVETSIFGAYYGGTGSTITVSDRVYGDPKLGPLTVVNGMPVVPLLPGSAAINAGSNALAVDASGDPLTTDAAGQPRIAGGTVDIGAYEYQPQPLLVNGTNGNDTISITGDASKLNWKINSGAQLGIPRSLVTAVRIDASQGTDTFAFDFDLLDDDLIIQANPGTRQQLFQTASDAVKAARNTTPLWSGHGITSSKADAVHGLAAILNEKLDLHGNPTPILGTLDGQSLDTNSIIVKYGLNGDANLDGLVNFDDYYLLNSGFLSNGALGGYRNGDFNYDKLINFDDYLLINTAFLGQTPSAVPQPSSEVALVLKARVGAKQPRWRGPRRRGAADTRR